MSEEKQEETKEEAKPEEQPKPKPRVEIRDITPEGVEKSKELRFTKQFYMTYRQFDGTILEGAFTIKRPTLGEQARVGVLMAELRQDKPITSLDRSTNNLHEWTAMCTVCVTSAPAWWDLNNMYDEEPLMECYAQVVAFLNSFRKPLAK